MNAVNAETLARLARIDTATICNVIEMFDVRPRNVEYTGPQIVAQFPELPVMSDGSGASGALHSGS